MMNANGEQSPARENTFSVSWKGFTIALVAVTLTALGTLATVVSVQNVDTLSTVALALAVLAFAAQLIISLAQASAGAQQIAQAERISSDTQAALAELRATAQSLLANQKDLFGHVLRAALPEVAREITDDSATVNLDGDMPLDTEKVELILTEAVGRALDRFGVAEPIRSPQAARRKVTAHPIHHQLKESPSEEEVRDALSLLATFDMFTLQRFVQIVAGIKRRALNEGSPTHTFYVSEHGNPKSLEKLVEAGLITIDNTGVVSSKGYPLMAAYLTPKGLAVAQAYHPTVQSPEWHKDIVRKIVSGNVNGREVEES